MYFSFIGGSALLHLLAGHPKVVAAFGIVATIGLLSSSIGPQYSSGAGAQIRHIEQTVTRRGIVDDEAIRGAANDSNAGAMSSVQIENAVREALNKCGQGCSDLTTAIVLSDPKLLKEALFVAALDRKADQQVARNAAQALATH